MTIQRPVSSKETDLRGAAEDRTPTRARALKTAALYAVLSGVWIAVSGKLVHELVADRAQAALLEDVKGWAFVAVTAVLLGLMLDRQFRGIRRWAQRIRESQENFRAMFEVASIGMAQADVVTGQWIRVNPKMCEITGYSQAELCGMKVFEITHPDDRASDWEMFQRVVRGEAPHYRLEKRYLRRNGSVAWVNVNMTVIRDAAGRPVRTMATIEDITDRKHLEVQLLQSQKMEAIGQLAGGVAHDFNNILAAMIMQAELASRAPALPGEVAEGLREITGAAERAAALTRQLLLFSRKQVMQPRDLDLNEVVTNLAKMLQRIIGEDVRLQLNLHPAPLTIRADAGMLDQTLMNLAVNARDAMPDGGRLIIETAETVVDADAARLDAEAAPGRYVTLRVTDSGCGIPPEVLPHVFEPFFTTKEAGKGTGLGLATVFGIVKQHQGWITVDSSPGAGTCFQVFLPAGSARPAETAAAPVETRGGSETVLLVEDDRAVRTITRRVLESGGYRVLEAASGADALVVCEQHRSAIALLLTDLVMPGGISGQELARMCQDAEPGLKVIYTSGYSPEFAGRGIQLAHGENFVQKPYPPDQLLAAIRGALDGRGRE